MRSASRNSGASRPSIVAAEEATQLCRTLRQLSRDGETVTVVPRSIAPDRVAPPLTRKCCGRSVPPPTRLTRKGALPVQTAAGRSLCASPCSRVSSLCLQASPAMSAFHFLGQPVFWRPEQAERRCRGSDASDCEDERRDCEDAKALSQGNRAEAGYGGGVRDASKLRPRLGEAAQHVERGAAQDRQRQPWLAGEQGCDNAGRGEARSPRPSEIAQGPSETEGQHLRRRKRERKVLDIMVQVGLEAGGPAIPKSRLCNQSDRIGRRIAEVKRTERSGRLSQHADQIAQRKIVVRALGWKTADPLEKPQSDKAAMADAVDQRSQRAGAGGLFIGEEERKLETERPARLRQRLGNRQRAAPALIAACIADIARDLLIGRGRRVAPFSGLGDSPFQIGYHGRGRRRVRHRTRQ